MRLVSCLTDVIAGGSTGLKELHPIGFGQLQYPGGYGEKSANQKGEFRKYVNKITRSVHIH